MEASAESEGDVELSRCGCPGWLESSEYREAGETERRRLLNAGLHNRIGGFKEEERRFAYRVSPFVFRYFGIRVSETGVSRRSILACGTTRIDILGSR